MKFLKDRVREGNFKERKFMDEEQNTYLVNELEEMGSIEKHGRNVTVYILHVDYVNGKKKGTQEEVLL